MPFSVTPCDDILPVRGRASASLPYVELEITRGQAKRRVRRVDAPVFLIGTADDCDLVLGDPQFPDVHSYLFLSDEGVWLRHLGVGPSFAVEGRLVKSAQLCDGDCLRTGAYEFRISIGSPLAWDDDGEERIGAPQGELAKSFRQRRLRASAGLSVVQELIDEIRTAVEVERRRTDVA